MEETGYNITNKEFKQLSKWAEEVYNIAVVVDYCLVVGIKRVCVFCLRKSLPLTKLSTGHFCSAECTLPTIRFCETQPEKEECYNLAPVVKHLHREADLLNAFFIDHEKD